MEPSTQFRQLPMFLTPHEVAGLHGGDYDVPIRDTKAAMQRDWDEADEHDRLDPDYYHTGVSAHGGPAAYIEHLKASGPIHTPVSVSVSVTRHVNGKDYTTPDSLVDGHHRAVAAVESNQLLPAHFYDGTGR